MRTHITGRTTMVEVWSNGEFIAAPIYNR